jgi:hypothetical protein
MDEDIETGRKAIRDVLGGLARFAHQATDANHELSRAEKEIQHEAVRGLEQLLAGLTDLGALAIAAARAEETD